ncbi:hypothetical protein HOLleu_08254 [Holothuria leucospilota]|uniref:Uncharacterized protein n=1 Tax=Holothuria leucospilota TaxID=206669 RepID=A0A9Q1CHZ3_HOLLE|nr:hypothetical protein HOLleu_08254 [Holothuria leucospilota]
MTVKSLTDCNKMVHADSLCQKATTPSDTTSPWSRQAFCSTHCYSSSRGGGSHRDYYAGPANTYTVTEAHINNISV